MFGWIQLTTEPSQMAVRDTDKQVSPKGAASWVDWIKATVRSIYPEKGDCPSLPMNAKWNTSDEAAGYALSASHVRLALW